MLRRFRFAARALARWRGGFVVAVLTLAIGIGATTSLYALVRVLLVELPGVPQVDRVGRIYAASEPLNVERAPVALHEFETQLAGARSFVALGAYAQGDVTIGTGPTARSVTAGFASPQFFRVLGVPPERGRVFSEADASTGLPVVLLGAALAKSTAEDGRDTASITVDGLRRTVIGIMPREFSYRFVGIDADIWLPFPVSAGEGPAIVSVFGRLRPGIPWAAANAELSRVPIRGGPWRWRAIPLDRDIARRAAAAYGLAMAPAIALLLIACVNVACLLLARGISREHELTVCRALGASRGRIARDVFVEHLVLALAGGALGVALAAALLRFVASSLAAAQPMLAERLASDTSLLPVALGVSVLASVVFGAIPSLRVAGSAAALKGAPASQGAAVGGYGARDLVVFLEVGSAVGLVVFAAMVLHLFAALERVRFSFPADRVVAVRVPASSVDRMMQQIGEVPGVAGVTKSAGVPGAAGMIARIRVDDGRSMVMSRMPVGAGFFASLDLPIVQGRGFRADELHGSAPVAIVSETAARAIAPNGSAMGMILRQEGHPSADATIVGICRDAIDSGELAGTGLALPEVYVPYDPTTIGEVTVLARVGSDAHPFVRPIADAVKAAPGSRQPATAVLAEEAGFRDRGNGTVVIRLLAGFALVALLLAASGIIAVVGQSVAMRTREFGVRLALGSTPRQLVALVLEREARLLATALACGAGMTFLLTNALFVELARLSVAAPSVWMALVGLCGGIAGLACLLATWRIARLEPAVVLRRT